MKEEIKLYCSECNELLCIQCALVKHPGHTMEDLNMYIKREKDSITDAAREMSGAIEKLDEVINTGKIVCNSIESRKKIVDSEINTFFAYLCKTLEEKRSILLQKCSDVATTKITAQTIQIDDLSSLKNAIEVSTQFADKLKVESEFLLIVDTVQARLRSLKKKIEQTSLQLCENDVINFNTDSSNIVSSLSTIEVTSRIRRDYTTLHDPILKVKTNSAYHVAIHESGDMIVANYNGNSIEVYDNIGTKKSSFGSRGSQQGQFNGPLGVALMGDILFVVEHIGNRCQKMTLSGEYLGDMGLSLLKYPWGCAVSKSGVLYVADTGNHCVQVFNPDGSVQGVLCSKPSVDTPKDVFIDQQENILLLHMFQHVSKFLTRARTLFVNMERGSCPSHLV